MPRQDETGRASHSASLPPLMSDGEGYGEVAVDAGSRDESIPFPYLADSATSRQLSLEAPTNGLGALPWCAWMPTCRFLVMSYVHGHEVAAAMCSVWLSPTWHEDEVMVVEDWVERVLQNLRHNVR
jgi:hypothetical protein